MGDLTAYLSLGEKKVQKLIKHHHIIIILYRKRAKNLRREG